MSSPLTREDHERFERERVEAIVARVFAVERRDRLEHLDRCDRHLAEALKHLAEAKKLLVWSGVAIVAVVVMAVVSEMGWLS